jgi:hypothetical protein
MWFTKKDNSGRVITFKTFETAAGIRILSHDYMPVTNSGGYESVATAYYPTTEAAMAALDAEYFQPNDEALLRRQLNAMKGEWHYFQYEGDAFFKYEALHRAIKATVARLGEKGWAITDEYNAREKVAARI